MPPTKDINLISDFDNICVKIDAVVVFPCVPAIAIHLHEFEIISKTDARFEILKSLIIN